MSCPWALIDAFTSEPFGGNPAAVVWLDWPREDFWRQRVAMEMNQAETAFLEPLDGAFRLRWFAPKIEVDLCGHATLASAFYLWQVGRAPCGGEIHFETKSGRLTCRQWDHRIVMDFPVERGALVDIWPADLLAAVPCDVIRVVKNRFSYVLELADAGQLRSVQPDFARLAKIAEHSVMITSRSDEPRFDFLSRFFAPALGINEDHATGSAHCCLGPYWAERLGKQELVGFQASPHGAEIHVAIRGERVDLGGEAVLIAQGELKA